MDRNTSILQAIRGVYDAASNAELWPQAFTAIGHAVAGDHVIFFSNDVRANRVRFATGVGVGPKFFQRLAAAAESEILPAQFLTMPAEKVRPLSHFYTKDAFEKSPFYNEVVRPDGGFDGLLAVPFREDGNVALLAIERLRNAPDYRPADVAALQVILPHLSNALRIRLKLEEAEAEQKQAYGAFDLLEFGVAIVDAETRPVFLNKYMEEIIRQNDGIFIIGGRVHAANVIETEALHRAVKSAAYIGDSSQRNEADKDEACRSVLRVGVSAPSLPFAFVATVMPMSPANPNGMMGSRARAIIFVNQSVEEPRLDANAVAGILGLSARQAMLAVLLARGATLAQAGAALGITLETARWHLKEIFEKTNMHRQVDLVRLVLRSNRLASNT